MKTCFDPIDYESKDNVKEWVMEEDVSPIFDYDELENMIYNDKIMPICYTTQKEGGTHNIEEEVQGDEEGLCHIGSGVEELTWSQLVKKMMIVMIVKMIFMNAMLGLMKIPLI
ncbi:hypothetical protein SLEP1_g26279 [Rubroshorea leprosula]|uniref:Uncharacterized protein n=1 Tax=Rubroshorea leprosula TaxID=152421 RepID=A0AAV5JPF5_9ROSI|nr:hypothetical protein SLEP1_g26279 [Rubroshorea leprosula]